MACLNYNGKPLKISIVDFVATLTQLGDVTYCFGSFKKCYKETCIEVKFALLSFIFILKKYKRSLQHLSFASFLGHLWSFFNISSVWVNILQTFTQKAQFDISRKI